METSLHLWLPFDKANVVQPFGANFGGYYQTLGLKGHPGVDFQVPWGTPIPNCFPGAVCSALLNNRNPDPMMFGAVNTVLDLPDGTSYELQYGHCSELDATIGKPMQVGDVVGKVGNTGDVFVNGVEVTAAEKAAGSRAGAHLHFQLRRIKRVPYLESMANPQAHRLNNGSQLYVTPDDFVYEIVGFDNGYNGCVDPMPFMNGILAAKQAQVTSLQAQVSTFPSKPTPSDLQALIAALEAFLGIQA